MESFVAKRIDQMNIIVKTMFFILVVAFAYMGLQESPINVFLVLFVMLGTVVGYFTNLMTAMLYSIFFVFIYASIHIFLNISQGMPISGSVYFWMLTVPVFAIAFAYYGNLIKNIQEQNASLLKENAEFVLVDKDTGLMSSQTFFNELQVFMKINQRYNIEVYLMLVKIKYENEVINILGEDKYKKMIKKVSAAINSMLREEDRKYILRDVNMFGIILLSNKQGGKYIKGRVKEIVNNISFEDDPLISKLNLEVQAGCACYNQEEIKNPYEFYKMAERDMEYDV